jgi:hypothetical protein
MRDNRDMRRTRDVQWLVASMFSLQLCGVIIYKFMNYSSAHLWQLEHLPMILQMRKVKKFCLSMVSTEHLSTSILSDSVCRSNI